MEGKNQYNSHLGAILTMIGVAVGLGNVWRFPYMMGSYGGSAFLLIYLLFTLMFAFPALITEMALGKGNRGGTVSAYASIFGNVAGKSIGYLLVGVVTIAGSYYAVVVGNVCYTSYFSITYGFTDENNAVFQENLSTGSIQYLFTTGLIVLTLWVSYVGLNRGIERVSRVIMPLFVLSILYMIGHAWSIPGAIDNVLSFLRPDFTLVGSTEVFAALGQAFFSVGLGGTFVVVYSGYFSENTLIPRMAFFTALGDLGSSFLVSLFLVPAMLVFSINLNAGPSLIFNTLPELFATMPAGRWIGSLFLISLALVAFLSLVAAFQVPLSSVKTRLTRKQAFLLFGFLQLTLAIPSAFYPEIIGILDMIFGSGMQVLGSMLAIIGVWWGISRKEYLKSLFDQSMEVHFTSYGFSG